MLLPTQAIFPGLLESAYRRELQKLFDHHVLPRLWAKDTSLWPVEDSQVESLKGNLRWLDLPTQLGPLLARVSARASLIEPAGFEDVVFVAMGDSNLAAECILRLPTARLGKRTFLLDNIDPDSVRAFEETLRLETHSLLLYFLERLRAVGIHSPGRHFVALTAENSYLSELAVSTTSLIVFFIRRASADAIHH